jgi:hypothetical protein
MSPLEDPRREAFAQALARGSTVREAARRAGYGPRINHSKDRARSKPIVKRVDEIARQLAWDGDTEALRVFDELMRLAAEAAKTKTPADLAAARGLLAEAARLRRDWAKLAAPAALAAPPPTYSIVPPELTKEEWLAAFAPRD